MSNPNFINKTWNCLPCRILIFTIAAIIIIFISLNPILNGCIKPGVMSSINEEKNLNISVEDFRYNIFSNALSAKNISISFKDSISADNKEKIDIGLALIEGVNWFNYFFGNGLSFDILKIENANGFIRRNKKASPDSISNSSPKNSSDKDYFIINLINSIPPKIKPLEVQEIVINNLLFTSSVSNGDKFTDSVKSLRIKFTGFHADSSILSDSLSLKFANQLEIFGTGIKYHFLNDYLIKMDTVHLSTFDSLFLINNLEYKPYVSDNEFFSRREFSSDRYIIKSNLISAKGVDFGNYIYEKNIYVKNIFLTKTLLNIASDISGRFDPSTFPEMPNEIFRSFKKKINIEKINISKSTIFVQSKYAYAKKYAQISFFDVNAIVKNISNIKSIQNFSNPCKINVTTRLEDKAKLSVAMNLPLLSEKISFDYKGHLESMSVLPLNNQLEVADLTKLTSGTIKYVDFSVQVDDRLASIFVKPIYKNLKIKKLDKETRTTGLLGKIASLFANSFVIKESNPDNSGKTKIGRIIYFKKQYDTFLDLVWISVKNGIGKVVGF